MGESLPRARAPYAYAPAMAGGLDSVLGSEASAWCPRDLDQKLCLMQLLFTVQRGPLM